MRLRNTGPSYLLATGLLLMVCPCVNAKAKHQELQTSSSFTDSIVAKPAGNAGDEDVALRIHHSGTFVAPLQSGKQKLVEVSAAQRQDSVRLANAHSRQGVVQQGLSLGAALVEKEETGPLQEETQLHPVSQMKQYMEDNTDNLIHVPVHLDGQGDPSEVCSTFDEPACESAYNALASLLELLRVANDEGGLAKKVSKSNALSLVQRMKKITSDIQQAHAFPPQLGTQTAFIYSQTRQNIPAATKSVVIQVRRSDNNRCVGEAGLDLIPTEGDRTLYLNLQRNSHHTASDSFNPGMSVVKIKYSVNAEPAKCKAMPRGDEEDCTKYDLNIECQALQKMKATNYWFKNEGYKDMHCVFLVAYNFMKPSATHKTDYFKPSSSKEEGGISTRDYFQNAGSSYSWKWIGIFPPLPANPFANQAGTGTSTVPYILEELTLVEQLLGYFIGMACSAAIVESSGSTCDWESMMAHLGSDKHEIVQTLFTHAKKHYPHIGLALERLKGEVKSDHGLPRPYDITWATRDAVWQDPGVLDDIGANSLLELELDSSESSLQWMTRSRVLGHLFGRPNDNGICDDLNCWAQLLGTCPWR